MCNFKQTVMTYLKITVMCYKIYLIPASCYMCFRFIFKETKHYSYHWSPLWKDDVFKSSIQGKEKFLTIFLKQRGFVKWMQLSSALWNREGSFHCSWNYFLNRKTIISRTKWLLLYRKKTYILFNFLHFRRNIFEAIPCSRILIVARPGSQPVPTAIRSMES